jgi:hypothetical protein
MPEALTHKELRRHAIERLVSEGYKEIEIDKRVGDDIIDVVGKYGTEKVAVECYVYPTDVDKKLDATAKAGITRFVMAIPEEITLPMVHDNVEVWKFQVELVGTPSKSDLLATACFPLREDLDQLIAKTAKEMDESKSAFIRKALVMRLAILGKLEGDDKDGR